MVFYLWMVNVVVLLRRLRFPALKPGLKGNTVKICNCPAAVSSINRGPILKSLPAFARMGRQGKGEQVRIPASAYYYS